MEKGRWVTNTRIKADATPIDNETKFAWDDNDYEEYEEWVEYTAEEIEQMAASEKQQEFISKAPDYFAALTSAFGEVE